MKTEKQKPTLSIEITPAMVTEMKSALKSKGWSLYRLQKQSKVSYNTLMDIFRETPNSNYRHLAKVEAIYKALGLKIK